MKCELCNKREADFRNITSPFVIPYKHVVGEDKETHFTNKNVRNICSKCYGKIEKTMNKLLGL